MYLSENIIIKMCIYINEKLDMLIKKQQLFLKGSKSTNFPRQWFPTSFPGDPYFNIQNP